MLPTYHNVRHLRRHFDVHFVCLDSSRPRCVLDGVDVTYVTGTSRQLRFARYLRSSIDVARRADIVLIEYFPGCSLIRAAVPRRPTVLDIRTSNVSPRSAARWRGNLVLRSEAACFRHLCVISEGVRDLLRLPHDSHILPLGAEELDVGPKEYVRSLRLLYLGSLTSRRIADTILGLRAFLDTGPDYDAISYDVVGDGMNDERLQLQTLVSQLGLEDTVILHGFVHHDDLEDIWRKCNVGISYVPCTKYFDVQPPTKTFEYMLAGLPVLATNTSENRRVVRPDNGVLIPDTPAGVERGLRQLRTASAMYTSEQIKESVRDYRWDRIIDGNLAPFLRSLL